MCIISSAIQLYNDAVYCMVLPRVMCTLILLFEYLHFYMTKLVNLCKQAFACKQLNYNSYLNKACLHNPIFTYYNSFCGVHQKLPLCMFSADKAIL